MGEKVFGQRVETVCPREPDPVLRTSCEFQAGLRIVFVVVKEPKPVVIFFNAAMPLSLRQ
jgi:hypothetical protein